MAPIRCPSCAADSPQGTVFCGQCGARVDAAAPAGGESAYDPATARGLAEEPRDTTPATSPPEVSRKEGTVPGGPLSAAMKLADVLPAAAAKLAPEPVPPAPPAGAPRRQEHAPPGTVVDGKYSIVRVLGEGGMGVVYLATDVHTGLEVVLKAVRPELAHRKDVRERTLAEGRALARIDHLNVVHFNAVVADASGLWLVMQFIDGESLDDTIAGYVAERRPMPVADAVKILRQILAGVGAAHAEGVIHRDLKPANVLIRKKDGVVKVTDFGIAKGEEDARAGRGATRGIIGSLWYMSPEQVTGRRDLDKRVDIYALGIVLYEMLVGRVPFDAESDFEIMKMHAEAPVPLISKMRRDVPAAIDEVIQRACAKDREKRFASCDEFLHALDAFGAAAPAATPGPAPTRAPAREAREAAAGGVTGQGTELPATAGDKGRPIWPAALVAVALLGGGAALVATGVIPLGGTPEPRPSAGASSTGAPGSPATTPPTSPASAPVPGPSAAPDASVLASLTGAWVGNGRELDAVMTASALEFRVRTASQFAPQDYESGEARFTLRRLPGESAIFAVEDHIRPIPPPSAKFGPASRGACQEVWSEAGGKPLRATWDGTRLSVEFAKIEPSSQNFVVQKGTITSCVGLRKLRAAKVVSLLTRP